MGIQAAPVAPTAGPSVMRDQGAGMPGERISAIPGMTSVLDRNVAPATMVAQGGERMAGMPVAGKEKPMTETQSNATAYGMRMKEANTILEDLAKKGVLKGAVIEATPLIGGTLGQVLPSALGGTSAAQQQVNQAKSNFITAVLRKESGAVISDSEFDREDKKYFPQINDNAAVIKQKENARKLAIKAIEVQAGPGAKEIQKYQPSVGGLPGASANDPLGLGIR
jgi:ABC-type glycerol-3-phosphate transport system substrate-binding protein